MERRLAFHKGVVYTRCRMLDLFTTTLLSLTLLGNMQSFVARILPVPPAQQRPRAELLRLDVAAPAGAANVRLLAVGDIMLAREVDRRMKKAGDIHYPFANVRDLLRQGDVVFGNLETSIVPGRPIRSDEKMFRSDPGLELALQDAGFTVLSLANNHVPDFGKDAIRSTIELLDSVGVLNAGAGMTTAEARKPALFEKNGIRFALLAYADARIVPAFYEASDERPGTAFVRTTDMVEDVARAKELSDIVIVSMHAGNEYVHAPIKTQQNFARAAIDAGATLVIGHHPHVLQPVEQYNGGVILYSLGNFVFDQMWSLDVRDGAIADVTFTKDGIQSLHFHPTRIEHYSQPRLLSPEEGEPVLKKLFPAPGTN